MARKELSQERQAAATAIRRALVDEQQVEAEARIAAEELIRKRTADARERTNAAIYRGYYGHNLSMAVILEQGFGTNRPAVKKRLGDYAITHPGTAALDVANMRPSEADPVATHEGLRVQSDTEGVTVMFDRYSHVDLGDNITGTVQFDAVGTELSHTEDLASFYANNPLWGIFVWSLPEVIEQT